MKQELEGKRMFGHEKRPSVRKKLEQAKIIAAEKQAAKELAKATEKIVPKSR